MDKKFIKKGQLLKNRDGDLTLLNSKYMPYPVDNDVVNIWGRLDGIKTVREIASDICDEDGKTEDEVLPSISLLVKELANIDLVVQVN